MERVAVLLANLFQEKLNYEIVIVNRDTSDSDVAFPLLDKVKVIKADGNIISFYNKIRNIINIEEPDRIIIHNMGKLSMLCSILPKKNIELLSIEHVSFVSRNLYLKVLSKLFYTLIDKVVVLTKNDLKNYSGKKVFKISNISPYPISSRVYSINSKKIIAVGRLDYQKNFGDLILAWNKIPKDVISEWTLEIWGDGDEYDNLLYLINKLDIKNIHLKGTSNNMEDIYLSSSFLVMSSIFEGLPMVLIEAQSFGLPIISFDCPYGPSEVVTHDKDGFLISLGDVDGLALAIKELILDRDKRISFSINARKSAIRYSQEHILSKWKNLLENK
ncbi:glycosyltransferase family 4 protein [Haemophilus haemolyticus]|uniref:glycosyltransferase family 4 protein n=1 Tax=Haemophilus haemolyticus TaxID=726 RepID=UPI001957333F|nr:glycosyltransferase family 4 protein [Haemophilus haemolyticus]